KRLQVLQPPVLSCAHFAQISSQLHKAGVFLRLFALLPGQDLIDFGEYELGSPTVELGQHRRIPSNEARQANQAVLLLAAGSAWPRPTPGVPDRTRYKDSCCR